MLFRSQITKKKKKKFWIQKKRRWSYISIPHPTIARQPYNILPTSIHVILIVEYFWAIYVSIYYSSQWLHKCILLEGGIYGRYFVDRRCVSKIFKWGKTRICDVWCSTSRPMYSSYWYLKKNKKIGATYVCIIIRSKKNVWMSIKFTH